MKTPRELLLARHQGAVPRLDALRQAVVAEQVGVSGQEEPIVSERFWERLWFELFWSCRRAWIGLAAGWAVVLLLQLAAAEGRPGSAPVTERSPNWRALRAALAEQNQYRAELLGASPRFPAGGKEPSRPGPRSDRAEDPAAA